MSTASTSALSSVLSALNNGNAGIDVTSAVNTILYADAAPQRNWQAQQSTLASQTTEIQQLESEASSLTDSLQQLSDPAGAFAAASAVSSDPSVSASALPGTPASNHTVQVAKLAATGSWYSSEQASASATLPKGSFQITEGGNTTTFKLTAADSTLSGLAASINAAAIGVSASVVTDSSGARLSLVAQSSGAAADFSVGSASGLSFTQAVVGADASLKIDGVPVTSASNTVAGAIPGLTFQLSGATNSPISISVSPDTSSIDSAVSSFVNAYNALVTDLNGQFTFSSSTSAEGVLSSDSSARSLQSDVLAAANISSGSGAYTTLASLGIATNQDGTLTLNQDTLNQAVGSNYAGVLSFFQGAGSTPGFAAGLIQTLSNYTDPAQGAFTVDLQSISNENQQLTTDINNFNDYLTTQQTLLTTEYNNANIALQQLPQQIKQVQTLLGENTSGSNS